MELTISSERFDFIKKRIVKLKSFTKQLQQIDAKSTISNCKDIFDKIDSIGVYIRQMPEKTNKIFRLFSDTLYFTQSRFKDIKYSLCTFVQKYDRQISKLLNYFYPENYEVEDYIAQLMKGSWDFEITLVLLWELYNKNAEIYFQLLPNTIDYELQNELEVKNSSLNWVKFCLFPNESLILKEWEASKHPDLSDFAILFDIYNDLYVDKELHLHLKLTYFWFTNKSSVLMLVNSEGNTNDLAGNTAQSKAINSTISYLQTLVYDLVKVSTKSIQQDDNDEDDFDISDFTQQNREIKEPKAVERKPNSQTIETQIFKIIETKPIQLINSKDLNEDTNFKPIADPKSGTPNTASNSSKNGSNKVIGARGKLNLKSQIYKAGGSKSAVMNETKVFNSFIPPGKSIFPQLNAHKHQQYEGFNKPMFNPNLDQSVGRDGMYNQSNLRAQSKQNDNEENNSAQNIQKFSSDTKINPQNNYTLFGDHDNEEFEFGHNLVDVDNEEGGKMASYIANSIFEEIESPWVHNSWENTNFNKQKQNNKDYDDGSVSSGSEKEENNFKQLNKRSRRLPAPYQKTKSYSNDIIIGKTPNLTSGGIQSNLNSNEPQTKFSSELNEVGQETK